MFCLSSGSCQAGDGFRIAVLMEVVTQQGKEIMKMALRCLLRDAVTFKNQQKSRGWNILGRLHYTRRITVTAARGDPSTCLVHRWAWQGCCCFLGALGGMTEVRSGFGKKPRGSSAQVGGSGLFHALEGRDWLLWGWGDRGRGSASPLQALCVSSRRVTGMIRYVGKV